MLKAGGKNQMLQDLYLTASLEQMLAKALDQLLESKSTEVSGVVALRGG
jgi:hypothetical protein